MSEKGFNLMHSQGFQCIKHRVGIEKASGDLL